MKEHSDLTSACESQLHGLCKEPLYEIDILNKCECTCHNKKVMKIFDSVITIIF